MDPPTHVAARAIDHRSLISSFLRLWLDPFDARINNTDTADVWYDKAQVISNVREYIAAPDNFHKTSSVILVCYLGWKTKRPLFAIPSSYLFSDFSFRSNVRVSFARLHVFSVLCRRNKVEKNGVINGGTIRWKIVQFSVQGNRNERWTRGYTVQAKRTDFIRVLPYKFKLSRDYQIPCTLFVISQRKLLFETLLYLIDSVERDTKMVRRSSDCHNVEHEEACKVHSVLGLCLHRRTPTCDIIVYSMKYPYAYVCVHVDCSPNYAASEEHYHSFPLLQRGQHGSRFARAIIRHECTRDRE